MPVGFGIDYIKIRAVPKGAKCRVFLGNPVWTVLGRGREEGGEDTGTRN
jgi:hypothetical protein